MRALICCLVLCGTSLAADPAPTFTRKPTAQNAGDKIKIDFAVSRETEVAVVIEDTEGQVLRHLVAGMLGKNPPPPFKANSLEQSIEWDGKDDFGKALTERRFQVRVLLGMRGE